MSRVDKETYYLDLAQSVAKRGSCLRRRFGAIIVKDDRIVATGYAGAPRGRKNCCDLGYCLRAKLEIPRGERYELCRSVHAEANAIIQCDQEKMKGATMYLVGLEGESFSQIVKRAEPCSMCKRMIINAGIKTVVVRDDENRVFEVNDWIENDESLTGESTYTIGGVKA